jgi:RNA polymerase sigma-70 factor (ECF subfamily)
MAKGDERALESLYDRTSRRVFALALQILKDRGAAEEATLDVFTQAWRQANRYDTTKGSPLGWLLNMTRARAIDLLRTRARRSEREGALEEAVGLAAQGPNPEDASEGAQDAARLRGALSAIPTELREALMAAYFCGFSHTEVASALGQPLGTVKTRIRSGLIQLRRLLAEYGDAAS